MFATLYENDIPLFTEQRYGQLDRQSTRCTGPCPDVDLQLLLEVSG